MPSWREATANRDTYSILPLVTCLAGDSLAHQKMSGPDSALSFAKETNISEAQRLRRSCGCLRQANIQRVELDLRWDAKEFPAALDRSSHLKPLPAGVEVWPHGIHLGDWVLCSYQRCCQYL